MTGAEREQTPAQRLAAVLDGAGEDSQNGTAPEEDPELAAAAAADDARRAAFDRVLATSNAEWEGETNSDRLREALVCILTEIRGPALETVGPVSRASASSHSTGQSRDDGAAASDAPLAGAHGPQLGTTEATGTSSQNEDEDNMTDDERTPTDSSAAAEDPDSTFRERAKYIPLRLSPSERRFLRLLEGALNVSQYTDVVDVLSYSRMKTKQRIHSQIIDLCSVLSGLYLANDYAGGQDLVTNRDFAANEQFFQDVFEIGRRHKIANPEKMRSTYGKLIFLLQDSQSVEIARMLDFSCVKPLCTVSSFLERHGCLELLDDPLMEAATQEIIPEGKTRPVIQRQIREKERAVDTLARRYKSPRITDEQVRHCLYSIGDNNAYLRCNRDPCDDLLRLLVKYFGPDVAIGKDSSLAIRAGYQGARLTHDHARQYQYCLQSLTLWREICHHMYKLWYMAESDLFDAQNSYHLRNTGQGLNRVQAAPRVGNVMYKVLSTVQSRVGTWIGSSVIHLGDSMTPNAFAFIDKYAQLQRILLPISTIIRRVGEIAKEDEQVARYIQETFGGVEAARRTILRDFFRFAFDGSGGTNMFDSGACVDGRLTSCWNWGSSIEKKPFFPLFLLCGFTGFDGQDFD